MVAGDGLKLAKIGLGEEDPKIMQAEIRDEMRRRFLQYMPYKPQLEFHNSTALERIMSGANQSGKTYAGAMEVGIHATGEYPEWWTGHKLKPRYDPASDKWELNVWVVGTDSKTVRDNLQAKIVGTVDNNFNDGIIHPSYILKDSRVMNGGVTGYVDNIKIKHKSGITAKIFFRSYEQGQRNLQSATIDIVYLDEEPPEEVIGELKARLTATDGLMFMAFTPLLGMTKLVQEFWNSKDPDKFLICMSMYESGHMTDKKLRSAEKRYASLSLSERNSRMYGIPSMGSGAVYPVEDEDIIGEPPEDIPDNWQFLNALDFGRGKHPNAIVFGVLNPATDILYIYDYERTVGNSVKQNARLIKQRGVWIPTAFPHDLLKDTGVGGSGKTYGKTSEGHRYKDWYEDEGVSMTAEHARTAEKNARVEVGITDVRKRLIEGRLKISPKLQMWFEEKAIYRYAPDNKPIKENDDLMDATRYLCIMLRYAVSIMDVGFNYDNNGEMNDETDIFN